MQQFIGIDFSGGVNAGRKIWIARGRVENDALLADPEGDALDSILAAWASYRARAQLEPGPNERLYRREGYVFV